jgi:tetratricopeptide (TPR) repeat protein
MSLALSQLSSFYSYRTNTSRAKLAGEIDPARQEQQIGKKIAAGDIALNKSKYPEALDIYLEAYAAFFSFLHPDFPGWVLTDQPGALGRLNITNLLMTATGLTAQLRANGDSGTMVGAVELPRELQDLVDKHSVGLRRSQQPGEVAYHNALHLLRTGDISRAQFVLGDAQRLNRGQANIINTVLDAHITAALAVSHILKGDFAGAQSALGQARHKYTDLRMPTGVAAVDNNNGVVFSLTGDEKNAKASFDAARAFLPRNVERIDARSASSERVNGDSVRDSSGPLYLLLAGTDGEWFWLAPTVEERQARQGNNQLRVRVGSEVRQVALGDGFVTQIVNQFYKPRVEATELDKLRLYLEHPANLLVALPHLYGFVLPMDIGDCYAALGRNTEAIEYYRKALDYEYLNKHIEAPHVWVKIARAIVQEGDSLYRRGDTAAARAMYEKVVRSDNKVPADSLLYQTEKFKSMRQRVQKVVDAARASANFTEQGFTLQDAINDAQASVNDIADNSEFSGLLFYVLGQETKLDFNLDWLVSEETPIWSFEFLQATARYYAQHAIQAWREYVSYRASAEQTAMTGRELEQTVTMAGMDRDVHTAQTELAKKQFEVTQTVIDSATNHINNLVAARDEFDIKGFVIADLDRLQTLATYAGNPINLQATHWDWGSGYKIDTLPASLQDYSAAISAYRNQLSHEMQLANFNQQIAEAGDQKTIAEKQQEVADAQQKVVYFQSLAADQRATFAEQNLDFFKSKEISADLLHALADRLGETAQQYLNLGIQTAFMMERAYMVENDRDLKRIRKDYADPKVGNLTAGDSLLLDIDSFTFDLLVNVKGKRNRVRHVISLADYAPQAFAKFVETGVMEFSITSEIMDRAYPGTYLHRIQNVEIEIEGLQVPEGMTGTLTNLGLSTWRRESGVTNSRITPPETMILSGFRLRRDLSLFRSDPNRLGLFENCGTAASWRLEVPPATNDIDYTTISDVRLVLFFHCLHSPELETKIRAKFHKTGEAGQVFSALLHAPDQFFAFGPPPNGTNKITFNLNPRVFPYFQRNQRVTEIGVHVLQQTEAGLAKPFDGVPLIVRMAGQSGQGTTNSQGTLATDNGAGALAALVGQPVGDVEIEFTGTDAQLSEVANVILLLNYSFDYR